MHQIARAEQYAFWNDWVHRSEEWEVNPDNARRGVHVLREVPRGTNGLRILDIGCGSGWLSRELASFGAVTATDLASEALEQLRSQHAQICWVGGDFMTVDLPREAFDFLACLETIAHVPDQTAFARRIAELAKPGGRLVLTTQNPFIWTRTSFLKPPGPGQIRNWPSREKLIELFSPWFDLEPLRTCAPGGDVGWLRLVNNRVSARLMSALVGQQRWIEARERAGLGRSLVLVGRRRAA